MTVNKITPFRIVVYYLLFSGAWIFFSDLLLLKITANTSVYSVLSIAKGWIFLLVTGALLYWLISHYALQQRQAKEGLRMSESKFETLFNSAGDGIFIIDFQGHILEVNDAACERLGYRKEELLRMSPMDLDTPEYAALVVQRISQVHQNGNAIYETAQVNRNGTVIPTEISSRIIEYEGKKAILSICRDLTERKLAEKERQKAEEDRGKLEEQLRQSQKMEAIGQLAGGVAHDFNNILTAIMGYGSFALMKMAKDDPQRIYIEHMLEGAERAAHLTNDLLLFSRKQISERIYVDMNEIIIKMENFLTRIIGEDISFKTILHPGAMPVLADAHQLEQVMMNLATNARDAMTKGGVFSVTTGQIRVDKEFMAAYGYGQPGMYALITVSDTGKGMDAATRQRIFEPFFTTKLMGKGTGLGMAVVYGIVKGHDGYINVNSEPGVGTTFRIYLPLTTLETEVTQKTIHPFTMGKGDTILIAEDERAVRKVLRLSLEEHGYMVIEAENGEEAVKQYKDNMEKVSLVLLDVIMPVKNGSETYDEIKSLNPDTKVIFMSGYTDDIIRRKELLKSNTDLIAKPIAPDTLLRKVREVLDR